MDTPRNIFAEPRPAQRTGSTTHDRAHIAPPPDPTPPTVQDRMAAGLSAAAAIKAQNATGHTATMAETNEARRQEQDTLRFLRENPGLAQAISTLAGQILESRFHALFESALPPVLHGLAANVGSVAPTEAAPLMAILDNVGAYWKAPESAGVWNGWVKSFNYSTLGYVDLTTPEKVKDNLLGRYVLFNTGLKAITPTGSTGTIMGNSKLHFSTAATNSAPWMCWEVGVEYTENSTKFYRLKAGGDISGTICIPVPIPTSPYMVIQQGNATSADYATGVQSDYVRAH